MNFKEIWYEQRHHEPPDFCRTTVCVLTKLWDGMAIVCRLPVAVRSFYLLQNIQIDSEARPAICSMDKRGSILEGALSSKGLYPRRGSILEGTLSSKGLYPRRGSILEGALSSKGLYPWRGSIFEGPLSSKGLYPRRGSILERVLSSKGPYLRRASILEGALSSNGLYPRRGSILETKPQRREADHSLPFSIKVKNERSFAFTFTSSFMGWIGANFYSPNLTS